MRSPAAPPPPPAAVLGDAAQCLDRLLPAAASVTCFASRWQTIRSRLAATLRGYCSDGSAAARGKLLMQSDLDMAAGWLARQINDLEVLLRSGVLHQSTAIVLSRPDADSSMEETAFFVRDLFARLQIGGPEFKRKALESLIQLLSEEGRSASAAAVVSRESGVSRLISLLDSNRRDSITELAVAALSLLISAGDFPRRCAFEEGALGPLLRLIESGSMPIKEKAAMAVESITSDSDHAWAVSAYGGVQTLIELCKSGSLSAQSHAIGAIRNISTVNDIRIALAEEGAIPILIQLLISGSPSLQEKAANCISIFASTSDFFRSLLLQEKAIQKLLQLFHDCSNSGTFEHVLRAIYSLSVSDACYRTLSSSTPFILQLSELVNHKNVTIQHISSSLLANLAISDGNKRAISGCMSSLVKLMECVKPDGMQEVGAKALVSLLSVKSNGKEFVRDEKSLMRLVRMLDPVNEVVSKKFPVAVVGAILAGGSRKCRRRLIEAGSQVHLQRLTELEVAGAKKALQRLSTNKLTSLLSRKWRG
ncbi:ARM repeat superfamily protein [Striga hermonthica]|uniref:ARM repeat superfamily protein n=1 Tax=Striga hermonthica TaxID=68872 RepID=A0A9N7N8J3_STRHE|nr:ARM repeat superfamily protein [Striga hermonthica]